MNKKDVLVTEENSALVDLIAHRVCVKVEVRGGKLHIRAEAAHEENLSTFSFQDFVMTLPERG